MKAYQITVEPKPIQGAGIGSVGCGRNFTVVTDSLQDAMSIARGHIGDKEQIVGIYVLSDNVVVDYSQVTGQNC